MVGFGFTSDLDAKVAQVFLSQLSSAAM